MKVENSKIVIVLMIISFGVFIFADRLALIFGEDIALFFWLSRVVLIGCGIFFINTWSKKKAKIKESKYEELCKEGKEEFDNGDPDEKGDPKAEQERWEEGQLENAGN